MAALRDLGYQPVEGKVAIRGFVGSKTEGFQPGTRAMIYVSKIPVMLLNWLQIKEINPEKLLNQVQQRYAYHAVKDRIELQGSEVVEENNEKNKTIHLTVRWTVFWRYSMR